MKKFTIGKLAQSLGCEVVGDSSVVVTKITTIDEAEKDSLIWVGNKKYLDKALETDAAAIIAPEGCTSDTKPIILSDFPKRTFSQALSLMYPVKKYSPGIHKTAVISKKAKIHSSVTVGPHVAIEDGVTIGEGSYIGPFTYIAENCSIGKNCRLISRISVVNQSVIKNNVIVHSNVTIGSDGFGYYQEKGENYKIPHVGNAVICDDVEVSSNSTIDAATMGSTIVGRNTKVDHLVHISHNVKLGENCILLSGTIIAGSTVVGDRVIFAGQSGVIDHLTIGSDVTIGTRCLVISDVPSGKYVSGVPQHEHKEQLRIWAATAKLPSIKRTLEKLAQRFNDL
ncbi:UDP-3-O-(3-hydroxymyristoyl)glucosamine N-acyltransferase [Candidatus Margulisiibacteriota bacterium]